MMIVDDGAFGGVGESEHEEVEERKIKDVLKEFVEVPLLTCALMFSRRKHDNLSSMPSISLPWMHQNMFPYPSEVHQESFHVGRPHQSTSRKVNNL
jgi:hypothetical protein